MARVKYDQTTPFGSKMYLTIQAFKTIQANLPRIKQVADAMTGGGATPAALEGSAEFGVAVGQGANFYSAIQSLDAAAFTTPSSWTPVQATIDLDQG
jgi:hypothetical protein